MTGENKKSLRQRPLIYVLLVVLIAAICAALFLPGKIWRANTQRLNLAGYTILLPDTWVVRMDGEVAVFYGEGAGDAPIGKARLINTEVQTQDFGKWFYFETLPASDKYTDQYAAPLSEQIYNESDAQYTEYVFCSLPNPQPYHFAMYFDNAYVKKSVAKRIVASFEIPDAGKNPPPKNITAPTEEEAAQESAVVYTLKTAEHTTVHNVAKLDEFIRHTASGESDSVYLLNYRREGESLILEDMLYLDFDGKRTLLYTYYQINDGLYSYSNNPTELASIFQTQDESETLTQYFAERADGELMEAPLFEFPKNPYQDRQDTLLEYKETPIGNNASVGAILDSLPTQGLSRTEFSLQTDSEPYGITVHYEVTDKATAYPDGKLNRTQLEKNAAVIFSLVENADKVTMHITGGDKNETLTFSRDKAEEYFKEDVRFYAKEPQKFNQYLEDVQNMPPSTPTPAPAAGSSSGGVLGEVVYSGTVIIPHGMKVTHPRTGKKVTIDPYAERYGYAQYLGKPISCVIYRTAGGYRAIASCGGAVLLEYALADERDLNYAISMIQAYGG